MLPESKLLDHCKEHKAICIADGPLFWPKAEPKQNEKRQTEVDVKKNKYWKKQDRGSK